ncbi:cilium assembly protein DZIP1L isoform X3 [Lissotriton helveticus]
MPGQTLQMPYQQSPSIGLLSGSMQGNMGSYPAFHFRSRRDSIDWRRFSAIDVDRVARELDVATLQANINSITFCNFDSEKCPYCHQPVDPVLLKVLKMAQLSIEYLLHSQEYLSTKMAMSEERLQATVQEHEQTKNEMGKMAEELKDVKEESKKRKKMLSEQQLLLQVQAATNNYHKCELCDKAFTKVSYLDCHVERRHPEVTEIENHKKKQVAQLEECIEDLKLKLKQSQAVLEEEKAAEQRRRTQDLEEISHLKEDARKDFEKWKEEERTRFQEEMDSLKHLFRTEFRSIESKNSTLEEKIKELTSRKVVKSNLGNIQDDEDVRHEPRLTQKELKNMMETVASEKIEELVSTKMLKSNLENIHDNEDGRHDRRLTQKEFKNMMETVASEKIEGVVSRKVVTSKLENIHEYEDGRHEHQLTEREPQSLGETFASKKIEGVVSRKVVTSKLENIHEYEDGRHEHQLTEREPQSLRETFALKKSQWKQMMRDEKNKYRRERAEIKDVAESNTGVNPVVKKPQHKELKEEVEKNFEDDGVETEEEEEEETDTELKNSFDKNLLLSEALRLNPNFIKQVRSASEERLAEKLKKMGVKKAARGISKQTFQNLKANLQTEQQQKAVKCPELTTLRAKLTKEVARKVKQVERGDSVLPLQPFKASSRSQSQPPTPKEDKVQDIKLKPHSPKRPKPSPRSKVPSPSNTTRILTPSTTRPSTPPFTSEEESMGDEGYLASPRPNQPRSNQQIQFSPRKQEKELTLADLSDTELSEVDSSLISTGPLVERTNQGSLVNSMARSLEKQLSGPRDKPFGGVSVLSGPAAASTSSGNLVRKLQVSDDSDIDLSSFDEITEVMDLEEKPKPHRAPQPSLRHSRDSAGSQATNLWSPISPGTGW